MKNNKLIVVIVFLLVIVSCKVQQSDKMQQAENLNIQPTPGPAPQINFGKAEKFKLSNGLQVILVENHKLPRASAYLSIDNKPFAEGDKVGVSSLMGSLLGTGTSNISKDEFNEKIDYMGASVDFSSSSASVSSLTKYFPEVLALMADAIKNSVFDKEELTKEKMQALERLKMQGTNVSQISKKVTDALTFGKGHPYGEFITEASIEKINLEDIKANYNTFYRPNNAFLTIVGDVNPAEVKKTITKLFGDWKKGTIPQNELAKPTNVSKTEIDFVDMPNAVQSNITLINNVNLTLRDQDVYAVMLANSILGGGMSGRLFKNLREDKAYTYGAYSSVQMDKYGSVFSASATVRNAVTDSAVVEFRKELDKMRNELVTDEELAIAKAQYTGNFVRNVEKPRTVANFALNIALNNLPADFYENYLENINKVTREEVQAAANKYFLAKNNRIVVVGKADDVLVNLEKVGLPINYFSKDAAPVEKPEPNVIAVGDDVTVESVVNKYFEAIGGLDKVSKVKSIKSTATTTMQGMNIKVTSIAVAPNKVISITEGNGQIFQKQVFDGKSGFMYMQGQTMDMRPEEIKMFKEQTAPFAEFAYKKGTLKAIEKVNGKNAYSIVLNNKKVFFDVESGLKVKEEMTQMDSQGQFKIITSYNDYKIVNGVKFPHTIEQDMGMGQKMKFSVKEVLVNKGVTDSDFKK